MPIYKRCSGCGKRILESERCSCMSRRHKEYDKTRDTNIRRFYSGSRWNTLAAYMKVRYQGLDIYELIHNNARVEGCALHHIFPVRDNWEKRFDPENLILLSESNHRKFHNMMDEGKTEEVINTLCACVAEYNRRYGYE